MLNGIEKVSKVVDCIDFCEVEIVWLLWAEMCICIQLLAHTMFRPCSAA